MGYQVPVEQDIVIDRALYPAYVSKYELVFEDDAKTKVKFVRVYFMITESKFAGQEANLLVSPKMSPRTKLHGVARALGAHISDQVGAPFDFDTMINKYAIILVEPKVSNGVTYNNVTQVQPYAAAAPGTSIAHQAAPPPPPPAPAYAPPTPPPSPAYAPPPAQPAPAAPPPFTPPQTHFPPPPVAAPAAPAPAPVPAAPPAGANPRVDF